MGSAAGTAAALPPPALTLTLSQRERGLILRHAAITTSTRASGPQREVVTIAQSTSPTTANIPHAAIGNGKNRSTRIPAATAAKTITNG